MEVSPLLESNNEKILRSITYELSVQFIRAITFSIGLQDYKLVASPKMRYLCDYILSFLATKIHDASLTCAWYEYNITYAICHDAAV